MRTRVVVLAAMAVFAIVATLTAFTLLVGNRAPTGVQQVSGVADVGGPFTLTDETGKTVTEADLLGKPSAIFFGFTFCPDVCPTTLYELSGLIDRLGQDADRMNWVFVSVDWERDGPQELSEYLSAFDERIRGFSGSEQEIEKVTKAYKVFYERVSTEDGGDYTINHTASVFLMDGEGRFFGTLGYGEDPETMLGKLKRLMAGA
ncbi:SCO family protein [Chelativorans xinjiangense]|uniref:SCO family protein n=1 Tax=Chelativorans xinjiangense TaxID=2681485 RepID=UPI001359C57D|nr:SCO family protein [Chelativorans xinjiangense]